jgi:hypothetical protein
VAGTPIMLIHPPVAKPCEPPAGIARLAGALRSHGIDCTVVDANIEGLYHLLQNIQPPADTWSRRAHRHMEAHLASFRTHGIYTAPDKYRRAVSDINRLLSRIEKDAGIRVGLANYEDKRLSPVRSADLLQAAAQPQRSPYIDYFENRIRPAVEDVKPGVIGISINFLSQALCAFALIGFLKTSTAETKIIIGGGLISSWLQRPGWHPPFSKWVDAMVSGPGETALIQAAGIRTVKTRVYQPDYEDLVEQPYLSPGFVLPFSSASGCWWRRCNFCPENVEKTPYHPLPLTAAAEQLKKLTIGTRPTLIHLLDNAVPPALLKRLADDPPGAFWYGFVRIGPPLDDPIFCRKLSRSGCVMLKIGLESGDPAVLEALNKGIHLDTASKMLHNLHDAGIATYVYLLFGTPAENETAAQKTLDFAVGHHSCIDFLNLAIFNLPIGSVEMDELKLKEFYAGDLQLYSDFDHPQKWNRPAVRQFVEKRFKKHPAIQPIIRRDPPIFTSNHAAFFNSNELR